MGQTAGFTAGSWIVRQSPRTFAILGWFGRFHNNSLQRGDKGVSSQFVCRSSSCVKLRCYSGLSTALGHCFPLWHGFRGGKGAGAAVGALIVIEPWLLLPMLVIWLITLVLTGYVSLSTVLAGFSLIPAAWCMDNQALMIFSAALALFLLFTHRVNIRSLRDGTENRFERIRLFSRKH